MNGRKDDWPGRKYSKLVERLKTNTAMGA